MSAILRFALLGICCLSLSACPGSGTPVSMNSSEQHYLLPLNLGNQQDIKLEMRISGQTIQGELIVAAGELKTQLWSKTLSFGRYSFTGSFSPPRGFAINGNFPEPVGAFMLNGNLPTQSEAGNFTFSQGGETVSDSLPALNTLPTPSPLNSSSPAAPQATPLTPQASSTASPSPTRNWTAEELRLISQCLLGKTGSQDSSRRSRYIQAGAQATTAASLASNPDTPWNDAQRQVKLNEAGNALLSFEAQMASGCVK